MKSRQFNVPEELIVDFAKVLEKHDMVNSIEGATEEGEVIVEVDYENAQRKVIHHLHDLIDDFNEDNDEENQEEDDE